MGVREQRRGACYYRAQVFALKYAREQKRAQVVDDSAKYMDKRSKFMEQRAEFIARKKNCHRGVAYEGRHEGGCVRKDMCPHAATYILNGVHCLPFG